MLTLALAAVMAATAPVPPDADAQFVKGVDDARQKAVEYLKKAQNKDGTWEGAVIGFLVDMDGGSTALVLLSLLEAGVPATDPALAKAIEHVAKLEPQKTYVVSLQTQVLARVDAKRYAKQIQANADWLLKTTVRQAGVLEGWSYPMNQVADGGNTHFAALGLHAAAQAGAKVDAAVWGQLRDLYAGTQRKDGGWGYYLAVPQDPTTPGMTAAALVGLAVAAKYDPDGKKPGVAFDRGMAAFVGMGLDSQKCHAYHLMATAELGRLLGTAEFKDGVKTRAWFRPLAEKLVKEQKEDGSWTFGRQVDGVPALATAFALYALGPSAKK